MGAFNVKKGILYGVSVGPGDPELLTMKAVKCLNAVPVIATPRTNFKKTSVEDGNTMALDIVKQVVDISSKEIVYLDFKMGRSVSEDTIPKTDMDANHILLARRLESYLDSGKDVAMLSIGDASLFSTYSYIRDIVLNDGYDAVTIPGVTSFSAVAATLNVSLTNMKEPLTIIPGSYNQDQLEDYLSREGTKVIMKSGKSVGKVIDALNITALAKSAKAVGNCGLENQKIYRELANIKDASELENYFLTILVNTTK